MQSLSAEFKLRCDLVHWVWLCGRVEGKQQFLTIFSKLVVTEEDSAVQGLSQSVSREEFEGTGDQSATSLTETDYSSEEATHSGQCFLALLQM